MLRWLTSGESHGPQLTVIVEGLPAGLEISEEDLRRDLARRQGGHGRQPPEHGGDHSQSPRGSPDRRRRHPVAQFLADPADGRRGPPAAGGRRHGGP
ncbi:MAG: chorismate synthase [Chloroflexi bacterium]|nr:MAG: chorismate synthase [Chloroflexota bacterium]